MLRISPTEPTELRRLGVVSSIPERHGVDVLATAHGKLHGLQRKTVTDLIASREDGRLQKELLQMRTLDSHWLLIGGPRAWPMEAFFDKESRHFTKQQLAGFLFSAQVKHDCRLIRTDDLTDTLAWLGWWNTWLQGEETKSSLDSR